MVTACLTCGAEGFSEALIFCEKCQVYRVHRYCLPVLTFDEFVVWFCEDCDPDATKSSSCDDKSNHFEVVKNDAVSFKSSEVKKRKHVQNLSKKSKSVRKRKRALNLIKKSKTMKKRRHRDYLNKESNRSKVDDVKTDEKNREQHVLDEGSVNREGTCINVKNSRVEETSIEDGEIEQTLASLKKRKHRDDLTKKSKRIKVDVTDEKGKKQHALDEGSVNEEGEHINEKITLAAIPPEATCVEDGEVVESVNERTDMAEDHVLKENERLNSSSKHRFEKGEFGNNNSQIVVSPQPITIDLNYIHAQPVQDSIWRGCWRILKKNVSVELELSAHVSKLACPKVSEEAKVMPILLSPQLYPRSSLWPKGFQEAGPRDDSIALYFFPDGERNEKAFNNLVNDMIHQNMAMVVAVQNAELLIFSSTVLPLDLWRFQAKFYLWGVFRAKQSPSAAVDPLQREKIRPLKAFSGDGRSPVSPLSNHTNGFASVRARHSSSIK